MKETKLDIFIPKQKEQIAREDLEWLFNSAESDMGIKSNYMSMVNVSLFGGSCDFQDPYNTFILNSTHKFRDFQKILSKLSDLINNNLFYTFGPEKWPAHTEKIFGKLTGIALYTAYRENIKLDIICQKIHSSQAKQSDKDIVSRIRISSQTYYNNSINSYINEKKLYFQGLK